MKIAVIGAGISGLSAAYRLSRTHDVTLFEANRYVGGHTNTVDVEVGGERHAIDTGFIVFNDWTYPNFIELLDELDVRSRPTLMGFSVQCEESGLEYNGSSLNGLFSQRINLIRPRFWRMVRDILRFNRDAPRDLLAIGSDFGSGMRTNLRITPDELPGELTVREYLDRGGYSREFAEFYLLPMGSAIWSCPVTTFESFPIRFIIEFYQNHGLLNIRDRPVWRVVEGGSRTYVRAILDRFPGQVRVNTPVVAVRRFVDRVEVTPRGEMPIAFEHVVIGCHADQALRLLSDPTPAEREILAAFPYAKNQAVLHTDVSVLPRRRRSWASWNYFLPRNQSAGATVTYCMNLLQGIQSTHVFNVSLNCEERINPTTILGRFDYEHPIFTTRRAEAQTRHHELIHVNRSSFCGAYWGNGFHEDGVVSGLAVCRALNLGPAKSA